MLPAARRNGEARVAAKQISDERPRAPSTPAPAERLVRDVPGIHHLAKLRGANMLAVPLMGRRGVRATGEYLPSQDCTVQHKINLLTPFQWPLDKRPPYYASQGDRFSDILHMLLKMRSLPPKATPRPDTGVLKAVDLSDENAARWFDMIKVTREFYPCFPSNIIRESQ